MGVVRVLLGPVADDLRAHYTPPRTPWLRLNFVATVDGAVQGPGGRSGDINNATDKRAFDTMRSLADAVVVGAGTARTEGYRPADVPIVVVSRSGRVPPLLTGPDPRPAGRAGGVWLVCPGAAPSLAESRELIGSDHVLTLGHEDVDLALLPAALAECGFGHLLCEGGPGLAHDLLAAGVVDELCVTTVPRLVAGDYLRLAHGDPFDETLELVGLLEEDGTLLARWQLRPQERRET